MPFVTFYGPDRVAERVQDLWTYFPSGWDAQLVLAERANGSFVYRVEMAGSPRGEDWASDDAWRQAYRKMQEVILGPAP